MAIANVLEDRIIIDETDATTGWTGSVTVTPFTADPDPIEATGCLGMVVSNTTQNAYFTLGAAINVSAGVLLYEWIFHRAVLDTKVNGGIMFQLGDGTNRVGYHLGGSDVAPFRHDVGPSGWMCMVLDTGQLVTYSATVFAGTRAALEANLANITQIGVGYKTLAKAVGGATNCFWDISRRGALVTADPRGIRIVDGTTPDPAGTFLAVATLDRDVTNQRAHGLVRELGAGVYGLQGEVRVGYASGALDTRFIEKNVTAVFESRGLSTSQYRFVIQAGTGTTQFDLGTKVGAGSDATGKDGVSLVVPSGVGSIFDASGAGTLNVNIYGSRLAGFSNGVKLKSNHEFIGSTLADSGTLEANGATLVNSGLTGSTATRALLWDVATDTNGKLDNAAFTMGASGHGIEFGPNTPSTIALVGVKFTGYGAAETTNAAVFNNAGKALTINITGGGDTPTVRNGAGASTTVNNTVTLKVTVLDKADNGPIELAQTAIYKTSDNSQLMNQDTETVDRAVNPFVVGVTYRIVTVGTTDFTAIGASSNTVGVVFTATGAGSGTGTATNGVASDSNFNYVSDTGIYIRVRKSSTGATKYIPASTTGTITSSGFSVTITLTEDTNA